MNTAQVKLNGKVIGGGFVRVEAEQSEHGKGFDMRFIDIPKSEYESSDIKKLFYNQEKVNLEVSSLKVGGASIIATVYVISLSENIDTMRGETIEMQLITTGKVITIKQFSDYGYKMVSPCCHCGSLQC